MAANYLHGVETVEIDQQGPLPVNSVKSSLIALVGTAPMGAVNKVTLVNSEATAAQFGVGLSGFSIPQALRAIFAQGSATVLVINVLAPATHKTSVTSEARTFDLTDKTKLTKGAVASVVVKNTAGTVTYVNNTDYTVDTLTGVLTRKKVSAIPKGGAVKVSYDYADPSKVLVADVIGGIDAQGVRTGMQALKDTFSLFGMIAKLLIVPGFCTQSSVSAEMIELADYLGGIALIDAAVGTTPTAAIQGRGAESSSNFNTGSGRAVLCYPHLKAYNPSTNTIVMEPYSQYLAGVIAAKDIDKGYWWSPSNTEIKGIVGVERPLSSKLDDSTSDVNLLNEVGITTIFNSFGTGFRVWGNRTAAFPVNTALENFVCVRRTGDVINESIRYFSQQYMDRPINQALIDSLVESVASYLNKLVGEGALIGAQCWFDPTRNTPVSLSAGQLLLSYRFTPPPPLERLTYESEITSEFLITLGSGASEE